MGAGAIFLLFLVIVLAIVAGLYFSGVSAKLWSRRTAAPDDTDTPSGPDLAQRDRSASQETGTTPPGSDRPSSEPDYVDMEQSNPRT